MQVTKPSRRPWGPSRSGGRPRGSARLSKDEELKDSLRAFRADTISYRNAWQFLSQIVDYQDPALHKRAIVATLLSRNLHMDGNQYDDSYLEGVQLSGVQLVPSAINEDHSVSEGSVAGFMTTFWGFLGEDEAAQAMAKNNSSSQLKASADFSHAVGIAMLRTCQENREIQSYMTDQSFLDSIVEITADALQAHYSRGGARAEA